MKETNFKSSSLGLIPHDWEVTKLGCLGEVQMCKRIFSYQTTEIGEIPFFKIGTLGKEPDAFISRNLYLEYRSKYNFPIKGEMLISAAGTIGRTVEYDGTDCYYQDSNIVWLRNSETTVSNKYLAKALKIVKWQSQDGGTISRLYNSNFRATSFCHPNSLTEQNKIAEVLSDVDELISTSESLLQKKRDIKQGTMQLLLSGKRRLPGFSEPWVNLKIVDFTDIVTGATPNTTISDYWGGDIRWMNSGELNNKHIYDVEGRISQKGYDSTSTSLLPKYCVLIGLAGQGKTRGTAAINHIELCTNQSIAAILPSVRHNSFFLYALLDSRYSDLRAMSNGDSSRGGLSKRILLNLEVFLPSSIAEQNAIAEIFLDFDTEIQTLEGNLAKYKAIRDAMMQQLLTGKIRLI